MRLSLRMLQKQEAYAIVKGQGDEYVFLSQRVFFSYSDARKEFDGLLIDWCRGGGSVRCLETKPQLVRITFGNDMFKINEEQLKAVAKIEHDYQHKLKNVIFDL